jgi:hypothetical protein
VAFSPDGLRLVSAGNDQTIRIWDATPRPVAPAPPPRAAGQPRAPAPFDRSGNLDALGFFTAKTLKDARHPEVKPLRLQKADEEFLVLVLSVPRGHFIPSEPEYQALYKEAQEDPTTDPMAARQRICVYAPERFHLMIGEDRAVRGRLLAPWPCADGFSPGLTATSSESVEASRRIALAVAWPLPAGFKGPFRVRLDKNEPVVVPDLRLQMP